VEIEQFKRVFLKKHKKLFKEETTFIRPIADLIELEGCPACGKNFGRLMV
jgi:hypothetical protein